MSNTKIESDEDRMLLFTTSLMHAAEEIAGLVEGDRDFMVNGIMHTFALVLSIAPTAEDAANTADAFATKLKELVVRYNVIMKDEVAHVAEEIDSNASLAQRPAGT